MTRTAVDQLIWLLDQAFETDDEHSVLANLTHIEGLWRVVPPGGERSIADIIDHVGGCKYLYENYAFGDGSYSWDAAPGRGPTDQGDALEWMREGHRILIESVRRLDDGDLEAPRLTNWGELMETRKILEVMIAHDFYHAGEINHIRAMLQQRDRWAHLPAD
jgi:uncharacterized damage-inducible protein DinB